MTAATSRLRRRGIGAGVAALVGLTGLGLAAVPAQAAPGFDPSASSAQVAGVDRFDTAAQIAAATFPTGADTVVIANGDRVIDAQAAGYVAGQNNAPILLTQAGAVPQFTLDAIDDLGATKAIVVGDDVSVSPAARAQLTAAGLTITTTLAGTNRFDTAADIYNTATTKAKTVFLARGDYATGQVSPDALAAGPLAYKGTPILLTNADSLPNETRDAMIAGGVTNVIYLGNGITAAVKTAVATALPTATSSTIAGDDRSLTAQAIANYGVTAGVYNKTSASIANGERVDALSAGPWAATKGTPILLTLGTNAIGAGTTGYLTANKATLTSATVFGDTNSVPTAFLTAATAAAEGGAVTSVLVTGAVSGDEFTYADPITKAEKTATLADNDVFKVDGKNATRGVFEAQLDLPDSIVISADTPSTGRTTYSLTNKDAEDYPSGLVGAFDGTTITVSDPIVGAELNVIDTDAAAAENDYTIYQVGGSAVTRAVFDAALSIGDTVSVTGTGADASHIRTVNIANGTVTGTVVVADPTAFTLKTAAGATLGTFAAGADDTLTVDGDTADDTAFNDALSVGDTVSFSATGGVQTIALTNAAPSLETGQLASSAPGTLDFINAAGETVTVTIASDLPITVNGDLAQDTDLYAAATQGDTITYQAADTASGVDASLSLTDAGYSGTVEADLVNTGSTEVGIDAADGTTPLGAAIDYTDPTVLGLSGTAVEYQVNGVVRDEAAFSASLDAIKAAAQKGSLTVSQTGTKTIFALATTLA